MWSMHRRASVPWTWVAKEKMAFWPLSSWTYHMLNKCVEWM